MFSYVAQFINYFTGGDAAQDDVIRDDELDVDTTSAVSGEKDLELKRSFNGKITSYFNNRGLINDHIYFTQDVVTGNEQAQVGDSVVVEASRLHVEGGWIAKMVQITTFWNMDDNDDNNEPFKELIIGIITDQKPHSFSVKAASDLTISVTKLKTGYRPFRGDWVQIEVWRRNGHDKDSNDGNICEDDIISVLPLREKKIHGTVTDLHSGFGFINGDIYFSFSVCKRGERVHKGDQVFALLIESKQKRGDWRALEVCRKINNQITNVEVEKKTDSVILPQSSIIEVKDNMDFGNILINNVHRLEIDIRNTGSKAIKFHSAEMENQIPGFSFSFGSIDIKDAYTSSCVLYPLMVIEPAEKKIIPVSFKPQNFGKFDIHISLSFAGIKVRRKITANVIDDLHANLTPNKSYKKPTFFGKAVNTRFADDSFVPGQRPLRKKKIFLPNKLDKYPIPTYLKDCISSCNSDIELLVPELGKPLHISTYKRKLSSLLYIEELQMEEEMREYDLIEVVLRPAGEFLSLNVPGLAEGRPSLLLGDRVVVKYHGTQKSPSYEGYIHEVHAEDVLLKFNEEFHNRYRNDDIDVQFYFNRTPLRRSHQAVDNAINLGEEVLFPKSVLPKDAMFHTKNGRIKPFNRVLNERQILAVTRILEGCARPIPYVLFGPPGTGKSITVVESILQVFKHIKHSRILACAPSNSAADLIAERLHQSGLVRTSDMVRLNAFHRARSPVPETVLRYSVADVDDLGLACRYRIIISTCSMAGFLYSFDLKVGHFTHIFVDEAGQATEPECLIPVGFAAGCDEANIVLAGDPFQLGPVLRSDISTEYGLGLSFLERLMTRDLYQRNEELYEECYNPLIVTKLINNYRSNEDLLKLSSTMFYNRELVPCADATLVTKFLSYDFLPNPNIPFIFHGLRSEDYREGNSPSWFNPMEAVQVLKYVQLVLKSSLDVDDIGVITPYRKQVEKIRLLFERFDLSGIKVGSVEEFQGQERQCIIISTVRSNEELVNFDCLHNVGFLSNPKRFNVSITRAQALLVIVGNPIVLCYDPYWCAMLQYAVLTGCYTGCDRPPLDQEIIRENFKKAFQLLNTPVDDGSAQNRTPSSNHPTAIHKEGGSEEIAVQLLNTPVDEGNTQNRTPSVNHSTAIKKEGASKEVVTVESVHFRSSPIENEMTTDQASRKVLSQQNSADVLEKPSQLYPSSAPHKGKGDLKQQSFFQLSSAKVLRSPQFEETPYTDTTQYKVGPYLENVVFDSTVAGEMPCTESTNADAPSLKSSLTLTDTLGYHRNRKLTDSFVNIGERQQSGGTATDDVDGTSQDIKQHSGVNLQTTIEMLNSDEVNNKTLPMNENVDCVDRR